MNVQSLHFPILIKTYYSLMTFLRYFIYICKHKYYVAIECFKYGLIWQGITHDLSKFLPSEFKAYAEKYYGGDYAYKYHEVEKNYDVAWLKHQHRNPHHWEYWLFRNDKGGVKPLKIPAKYVLEMVCDWIGAGIAIKGKRDIKEWYSTNKMKMILHRNNENHIDVIIKEMECDETP